MNIALRTTHIAALMAAGVFLVLLSVQPAFAQRNTPNTSTGASCITPWGNRTVAHGQTISSEPGFTNGALSMRVVVPLMRCNNGTWLRCDYRGNNCMPIANTQRTTSANDNPTPTRSEPIPLPLVPKSDTSSGASCVTPLGNKTVADGASASYYPYFTKDRTILVTGTVVLPTMRCNNGAWLECIINNCHATQYGQAAPAASSVPIPLPRVLKNNETSTSTHPCNVTSSSGRSGRVVANIPCGPEINAENWGRIASTARAHFLEQAQKLSKNRQDNERKRQDRLSKIEKRVSDTNFKSIRSILERLGDAHDKLSNLLVKIDESLAKAATAGKDVTAAQTATTQAENDLVAAQTAIDAVQTVMDTATASGAQIKDHIGEIRTAVTTAVEKIRTANASVTAALKAARNVTGASSTSSYRGGWQ